MKPPRRALASTCTMSDFRFNGACKEGLAAVIFLDVDGVLHALKPNGLCRDAAVDELTARADAELDLPEDATASVVAGEFAEGCMARLKRCVEETGASIVLSSTWRETAPQRRAVDGQLRRHGLPACLASTPMLGVTGGGRSAEILWWVNEHKPTSWVALDDTELALPDGHFVRTDPAIALADADAELAIKHLRTQMVEEEIRQELETQTRRMYRVGEFSGPQWPQDEPFSAAGPSGRIRRKPPY